MAFLVCLPVVLILYIGYGILQAYYGPTNVMIEATFDKQSYAPGETVLLNVKVSSAFFLSIIKLPIGQATVGIEVRNRSGILVYVDQGETDTTGQVNFMFSVPNTPSPDEYTVYMASPGNSISAKINVGS